MSVLAEVIISPVVLDSFSITSVVLLTVGTLFLAYDLLGRENGPLQWLTLVITCGLVSALVLIPVVTLFSLLFDNGGADLIYILKFVLVGGLMGFFTVILVELPASTTRPPIFSRKGSVLGLALGLLFCSLGFLLGPTLIAPAFAMGIVCAILVSTWQRLTWEPTNADPHPQGIWQFVPWEGNGGGLPSSSPGRGSPDGDEPRPNISTSKGTWRFVDWKPPHPKPRVFSRKGFLFGLLLGYIMWSIVFFTASREVVASLLAGVPLALICGVIFSTWRYINWEPKNPGPHIFSRKGSLVGLVAGFVLWLVFALAQNYPRYQRVTGPIKGLEAMVGIFLGLLPIALFALANAAAGSIAQYILWKANKLPHRVLGAIGLVLILFATALQVVVPLIDLINNSAR